MVSKFFQVLIIVFLSANLSWAKVTSQVDRSVIEQGGTLNYILDLSESEADVEDIDLSPLEKDFDILNRSQQSSTTITNGQFKSSTQLVLSLAPKTSGNLRIPSLTIDGESTPAHAIQVRKVDIPTAAEGGFEAYSTLSNTSPRVQQSIVYNFTLLLGRQVNGSIAAPEVTKGKATVEPLGEQNQYKQVLKGKEVVVVEQSWLITPQQSGELSISAAKLIGQIPTGQRRRDPFNGMMFRNTEYKRINVPASSYEIQVGEVPSEFSGSHWLAAESVAIEQHWDTDINSVEVEVGQPVTRTLVLSTEGASRLQLKMPELPEADGFKQYPDTPEGSQIYQNNLLVSELKMSVTMIPSRAGTLTLPEVRVPWWNVTTNTQEYSVLPAQTLKVIAAQNVLFEQQVMDSVAATEQQSQDLQPNNQVDSAPDSVPPSLSELSSDSTTWYFYLLSLVVGSLVGAVVTYRVMKPSKTTSPSEYEKKTNEPSEKSLSVLKAACSVNDARAARIALDQWVRSLPNVRSLNDLLISADPVLQQQVNLLNQALYSKADYSWQGSELYRAIKTEHVRLSRHLSTNTEDSLKEKAIVNKLLPPLYPK